MPEISPELAARIHSLQDSHAENPARFFMPLASAWREAGETGRAEELLRENLKRHPGYLSAHVLLGRCLADRGAYAEARNEFQYVLSVDPQNLIALRTLGDMAAAGGDAGEARRWYGELLSVDPMNAEARQALSALDAAPAAAPAEAPAQAAGGHDGFGMVEIDSGAAHAADHPAAHADPGTWGELSLEEPALASPAPESAPPAEPAGADFEAMDFGAVDLDAAAAEGVPAEPAQEETREAAPAGGGFDTWGSVDDGQAQVQPDAAAPLGLDSFYSPEPEAAPAEHHEEHDEHEVVTETIAELYARQGFPDRAADVYRELIARRGQEPALVRRLQELEHEMAGASSAPADEAAGGFQDLDLTLPAEQAAAAEPAAAGGDEQPGAASWLETVDAVVAGTQPAGAAADAGSDAPAPPTAGDLDLAPRDEPQPAAAQATGDAFADSFAHGFGGTAEETERRAWEAPRVEEAAEVPELAGAAAFASTMEEPRAEPSTEAEPVPSAEPGHAGHSISAYLSSILSWRPRAQAAAADATTAEAPPADAVPAATPAVEDDGAPPAERPWDEATLGAPVEQPPMDEPWIAGGPAVADHPADAGDEPWAEQPSAADESAAADAAPVQDEPWAMLPEQVPPGVDASADEAAPAAEEDLPWLSGAGETESAGGTEPAAAPQAAAGDEPMPWETPFELSPEVPAEPQGERAEPRQEPVAEPGAGFSFEDFFAERPAEPAPPAEPEPSPAPAPPADAAPPAHPAAPAQPQAQGGEEDEDLESFQAWLQSLKR